MRWLALVGVVMGCEAAPPAAERAAPAPPPVVAAPRVDVPPPPVAPAAPDYEDARGVVRRSGADWLLEVEGGRPICVPFEAPADVRRDGAQVRFTLYLGDGNGRGCRPVDLLVSMTADRLPAVGSQGGTVVGSGLEP